MAAPDANFQPMEITHGAVMVTEASDVPDNFIKVGCCAFRCDNFDWPGCFGCKQSSQVCCMECDYFAYQCYSDDEVCCVPESAAHDCVPFSPTCNMYNQCFCFEMVCNKMPPMGAVLRPMQGPNIWDPIVYQTSCCATDSCLCKFPDCCKYSQKAHCCCVEGTRMACKPSWNPHPEDNPRSCCLLSKRVVVCYKRQKGCSKSITQVLCYDRRNACPNDQEVPCGFTVLPFWICCVNGGCNCHFCASIGQMSGKNAQPPPHPTTGQVQQYQQQQVAGQPQTMYPQQMVGQPQMMMYQQPINGQPQMMYPQLVAGQQLMYPQQMVGQPQMMMYPPQMYYPQQISGQQQMYPQPPLAGQQQIGSPSQPIQGVVAEPCTDLVEASAPMNDKTL